MTPVHYIAGMVLPLALSMLPPQMDSPSARAMLIAIGLQESRFKHRRQIEGPARSYWQFERAGISGVLRHESSRRAASDLLGVVGYRADALSVYDAIEHNDILACGFARLLLWTHPERLPGRHEANLGWRVYADTWRPGKPHPQTWPECFEAGWGGEWPMATQTMTA